MSYSIHMGFIERKNTYLELPYNSKEIQKLLLFLQTVISHDPCSMALSEKKTY